MRNRNLILFSLFVLAVAFAAGCAKRGMTKSEMDRADAIAAKIARAEKMGIKDCNPKELADAKAALDRARQEAAKDHEKAETYFAAADKAADDLILRQQRTADSIAALRRETEEVRQMIARMVHFDFDKSFIRDDAKPALREVASFMKKNPGAKLQIEGHCDERGTPE